MFPTIGEGGIAAPPPPFDRIRRERLAKEAECRTALASRPTLRKRFDALLVEAQRAHQHRLEQTAELTLGWPAMRAALGRIGEHLAGAGVVGAPEDVYFLRRDELASVLEARDDLRALVVQRRADWERAGGLTPPLVIGELPKFWRRMFDQIGELLSHDDAPAGALVGHPASPGRVAGAACVIRSMDELAKLRPGEILVAPVTTPAGRRPSPWQPVWSPTRAAWPRTPRSSPASTGSRRSSQPGRGQGGFVTETGSRSTGRGAGSS